MQLINCKVELKIKLTKSCVLAAAGNDTDANPDNIISTNKDTKLCSCHHFIRKRQSTTIKTS